VNFWLNLPLDARYLVLALIGALLGSLVNLGTSALAFEPRPISPWMRRGTENRRRSWFDRIPIVGWLGLRRERDLFGGWTWLRAMLVEIAFAIGVPVLYWWEVVSARLWMPLPGPRVGFLPPGFVPESNLDLAVHAMFACHAMLATAMVTASLIDIREKIIPDGVTVPVTLIGLITAAIYPWSRLPAGLIRDQGNLVLDFLKVNSPMRQPWPHALGELPNLAGLAIGLGCYLLWIAALLPRPWRTWKGYCVALRLCGKHFWPALKSWDTIALIALGTLGIGWTWFRGGPEWIGLSSALIGMIVGGGMVWVVRVLGTAMLNKEAMGFGDVTLMAMIGTFLGWQPCLLIFFLAPMLALIFGILQLILSRNGEIYYGPFLCFAAGAIVVRWPDVWNWAWPMFDLGWLVPAAMSIALVAMIVLLSGIRWIREKAFGG
jgi:leader peptidase (prepilin peptidase)/N-methyltransferase